MCLGARARDSDVLLDGAANFRLLAKARPLLARPHRLGHRDGRPAPLAEVPNQV